MNGVYDVPNPVLPAKSSARVPIFFRLNYDIIKCGPTLVSVKFIQLFTSTVTQCAKIKCR
jgi:hypothetical protein